MTNDDNDHSNVDENFRHGEGIGVRNTCWLMFTEVCPVGLDERAQEKVYKEGSVLRFTSFINHQSSIILTSQRKKTSLLYPLKPTSSTANMKVSSIICTLTTAGFVAALPVVPGKSI